MEQLVFERRTKRKMPVSEKLINEYYYENKTTRELANQYKVTEGTVRNWLVQARRDLGVKLV